jgi:hypothetical protein
MPQPDVFDLGPAHGGELRRAARTFAVENGEENGKGCLSSSTDGKEPWAEKLRH